MLIETWPIDRPRPYDRNPRDNAAAVDAVAGSLRAFGWRQPIVVDAEGVVVAGHTRLLAARMLGMDTVPVHVARDLTPEQAKAYRLADNRVGEIATWDLPALGVELGELRAVKFDLSSLGWSPPELAQLLAPPVPDTGIPGALVDRFGEPPFTVLDGRSARWQDRKREWLALGIRSEMGRDAATFTNQSGLARIMGSALPEGDGTSIFDPVLTELLVRWFSPRDGQVVDPFAGGSVRGIVAAKLGRAYHGIELRPEQVEANREQAADIIGPADQRPGWVAGDSRAKLADAPDADLILSCPPYGDLETYSDDPADLSNMPWPEFLAAYRAIIARACAKLRPDRFACWVVGDVRDRGGLYRDLPGETVAAFRAVGLGLYNHAVLVSPVGSLAVRAGRQFAGSRKLGTGHQHVLVFVKDDPRAAVAACGEVVAEMPG